VKLYPKDPRIAEAKYFAGKIMHTTEGTKTVTQDMAEGIEFYLIQNGYVDRKKKHCSEIS